MTVADGLHPPVRCCLGDKSLAGWPEPSEGAEWPLREWGKVVTQGQQKHFRAGSQVPSYDSRHDLEKMPSCQVFLQKLSAAA